MWESNKFPSVHINPQNVSGSWDDFWTEFSIAMELLCLEISETYARSEEESYPSECNRQRRDPSLEDEGVR